MNSKTIISLQTETKILKKVDAIAKKLDRSRNYLLNKIVSDFVDFEEDKERKIQEAIESIELEGGVSQQSVFEKFDTEIESLQSKHGNSLVKESN